MSLKSIGAVSNVFNVLTKDLLNGKNAVIAMQFALKGMEAEQVVAATKTLGLDAAQTAVSLSAAGMTESEITAALATRGFSKSVAEAALVQAGFTPEVAASTVAQYSFAAAEGTATVAVKAFAASVVAATKGLIAFLTTNPVGWAILAAGAIFGIVKAYDALTVSAEEATEAMETSVYAFEEATSQLESINKELETTKDRIDELEAKDFLTFVEESELKKLRDSVELLQIQADLAEKERTRKAKDAADDTITAYEKNFKHDISTDAVNEYFSASSATGNNAILFSDESNIAAMLAGIEQMERLRDELDKSSEYYQEDYQHFQGIIDDVTDSIWEQISVLGTYKSNLEAIPYDKLTDDQKAALDEINAAIELIYKTLDPAKWNEIQWGNIVSDKKYSDDVKKLNELAAQSEITADTIKEQFPALAQACADAGVAVEDVVDNLNASFESADGDNLSTYTAKLSKLTDIISGTKSVYDALKAAQDDMDSGAGLSTDTIEKLAKENENYLDYLYKENDVIKLNTEAWKENANAKMQNEMAEIQKEIDSLNERNKVLLESIAYFEQMKDADGNVGMWDQEIAKARAEIEKNTEAVGENQDKMALYEAIFKQIQSDSDDAFSSITDHLTFITGQYDLLTKAQEESAKSGVLSASTLSSIADKFPEMEDSVNLYIAGLKTSQELLDELSVAYGIDFENYQRSIVAKLESSEEFYNALTDDQKKLIDELGKSYGVDLENFKSIESKKLEFQAKIIEQLASNYSRYSGASLEQMKAEYDIRKSIGGPTAELYDSEMAALGDAIRKIESYNKSLSEITAGSGLVKAYDPKKIKSSTSGGSASKEVEEYTVAIDQYREAAERLRKVQEARSVVERKIDGTDDLKEQIVLQKQLIDVYQQEQSALHNLNDQRDATIIAGAQSLRELGFAVQYNADTNELWISNMEHLNELTAKSKGKYDSLQEATNALRKDTEELIGTITDLNDKNREGSSSWVDLKDSIHDAKLAIVNDLKDIVDQEHSIVDEIQNVYDTLYEAADEFAANDGFITVDTYQALLQLGPQYMQMLKDENGLWQINEERINDVIAARTRQLAVENAMSYVERLKLAAQEGSIEDLNNLCFATTNATNSTWGLVYAELELMHTMGELNDSQYLAALHNIEAMQDLANNVVANIGKATDAVAKNLEEARKQLEDTKKGLQDLLDELEDMEDGASNLVKYVMDMLKHRIQEQIDLLEEMKDKYSEIIDLKKDSLDTTKDEQDYQKSIAKKLKEMTKLQERINALALDDSRSAQAERAKLLEEMAELQENLADSQADKSIESQKEALDQMEKDYHEEKDNEIKILEDSISSYQKLYDMAINYIRNNWDTLYQKLIAWNTEYGSVLNSEITAAWEAAQAAAQRYGDFVSAIMGGISAEIDSITKQIESLDEQMSNLGTSSGGSNIGGVGTDNKNTTVGNKTTHTSPSSEDMVRTIVGRMKEYGAAWSTRNDKATNDALHQKAANLAHQLDQYGVHADFRDSDGTWWITRDDLHPNNVGKMLHSCYHTGGFVGDEPLKPNEQYIKAENGELMMTSSQQDSLAAQLDRISAMADVLAGGVAFGPTPAVGGGLSQAERGTINNITNNSRPIEINVGDTIIQGNASAETVAAHGKMTEKMVNDLARMVGVKW